MSKMKRSSKTKMKIGLIHLLSNPNVVVDHFRLDNKYLDVSNIDNPHCRKLVSSVLTIQFHNHEKKDE